MAVWVCDCPISSLLWWQMEIDGAYSLMQNKARFKPGFPGFFQSETRGWGLSIQPPRLIYPCLLLGLSLSLPNPSPLTLDSKSSVQTSTWWEHCWTKGLEPTIAAASISHIEDGGECVLVVEWCGGLVLSFLLWHPSLCSSESLAANTTGGLLETFAFFLLSLFRARTDKTFCQAATYAVGPGIPFPKVDGLMFLCFAVL